MKQCANCHETKALADFKLKRNWCLVCWRARHREYMRKPKQRADALKRNYGWRARYVRCRRQAQLRGISFDLTPEEYQTICDQPCFYCGYPTKDTGSGLDRKDSKGAYRLDNIVPSCSWCNWAKNAHLTFEEAIELGKTIRLIRDRRQRF